MEKSASAAETLSEAGEIALSPRERAEINRMIEEEVRKAVEARHAAKASSGENASAVESVREEALSQGERDEIDQRAEEEVRAAIEAGKAVDGTSFRCIRIDTNYFQPELVEILDSVWFSLEGREMTIPDIGPLRIMQLRAMTTSELQLLAARNTDAALEEAEDVELSLDSVREERLYQDARPEKCTAEEEAEMEKRGRQIIKDSIRMTLLLSETKHIKEIIAARG